jgi:hypothetical protein
LGIFAVEGLTGMPAGFYKLVAREREKERETEKGEKEVVYFLLYSNSLAVRGRR